MNINRLIKELKSGHNVEQNLKDYSRLLLTSYLRLSFGRFAMNFTENYDVIEKDHQDELMDDFKLVCRGAKCLVTGSDEDMRDICEKAASSRDHVLMIMKDMEDYLHYFKVYEYIVNRQVCKYEEDLDTPDTEVFVSRLMSYISQTEDAQNTNNRIQSVFGELPVRLTTMKFFELLERGCRCYEGARNDMAETFFAHMEAESAAPKLSGLNAEWKELYECAQAFENKDYANLTEAECNSLLEQLDISAKLIAKVLSSAMQLLDMLNDFLIIVMTKPYVVDMPVQYSEICVILRGYLKYVDSNDILDIDADVLGGLAKTVETHRKYIGEHMLMEDSLELICHLHQTEIEQMMSDDVFRVLQSAKRLFPELSRDDIHRIEDYFTADRTYVAERIKKLEECYRESFKAGSQLIKRSLIAMAFEQMPVPFDQMQDVERYIRQSLDGCRDPFEKAACIRLLEDVIQDEAVS